MIDKKFIAGRFGAHFNTYDSEAAVQMSICDRMAKMVSDSVATDHVAAALEIGAGTGFLSRHLLREMPRAKWLFNDIAEGSQPYIWRYVEEFGANDAEFICCDGESELSGSFDLVASSSAMQWFNDVEGYIAKLKGVVNNGGYVALSLFAPDNFCEVAIANSDVGLSYHTLEELTSFFEAADFEVADQWEQCHRLLFNDPMEVLRHIKLTGVNASQSGTWTRGRLNSFCQKYIEEFGFDLGVTLTYHPVIIIAKKR